MCKKEAIGPLLTTKQSADAIACAVEAYNRTKGVQGLPLGLPPEPTQIADTMSVVQFQGSAFSALLLTSTDDLVRGQPPGKASYHGPGELITVTS